MLALARALMLDPALILLDEPSAGLSPEMMGLVFERIRDINRSGVAVLLVEQNAREGGSSKVVITRGCPTTRPSVNHRPHLEEDFLQACECRTEATFWLRGKTGWTTPALTCWTTRK